MNYREAGVDRGLRAKSKEFMDFKIKGSIKTPFNVLYPISSGKYNVKTSDGVGTKVLLAELADEHDTIGIDAVAMVANDCLRCGARPVAVTDIIDAKSSDPSLLREIMKGLQKAAKEAGCPIVGGETADVPELLNCLYHINCDCVGEVAKRDIIYGKVEEGDVVVGLPSSGLHSNGFSLARKVLFRRWGGAYSSHETPEGLDKELVYEALTPTRIYVKEFFKIRKKVNVKAAVHITGDAYLKFKKLGGFEFFNFKPRPIFHLIQKLGVPMEEMFRTFNMGWGFALVVDRKEADSIGETIGRVTKGKSIDITYEGKRFLL